MRAAPLGGISFAIDWFDTQTPRNEREIAIHRAIRARIRQAQGDRKGALEDVAFSLSWFMENLPDNTRSVDILQRLHASIQAEFRE